MFDLLLLFVLFIYQVPLDRILLETDAPDALPKVEPTSLLWVPGDPEAPTTNHDNVQETFPSQALNHPANIKSVSHLNPTSTHYVYDKI